ncbi:hypothetical protein R2R35_03340 [Anaerocolumna sp. AGMB13020]|uniref:hypothetical protein n=1 Tax=Anaerocolumna sp. AGMB13020 TaxID=3081750 RepID=UPI0029555E27|nr:hypothetical protein [Anaerocolumna sp. AGMB13020]WOO37543.1 hypothetical protein R2R35_03340 [Anaerocolumna sp. AGMB13020]
MKNYIAYMLEAWGFCIMVYIFDKLKLNVFHTKGLLLMVCVWAAGHVIVKHVVKKIIKEYTGKKQNE